MSSRVNVLFADYASHHRTRGNKICHRIGIPTIMFSLIGMLQHVPLFYAGEFRIDVAMLLIAAAEVVYLMWSVRLGAAMLPVSLVMYVVALYVPLPVHVGLFVAGWILQFLGHARYEKQSPAFLSNLLHLLVGPLWILQDVTQLERAAE